MAAYRKLATARVPQTEPMNERQVKNNAGGFVFQVDDFARLDRFLIIGSSENTYYQTARKLTRENAECVQRCLDADAPRTIARIVEVSTSGRAPKNDAAIFALALAATHSNPSVVTMAYAAMPQVCRIATHLFQFLVNIKALGKGWGGNGLKRAIANWYDSKGPDKLAYQVIKYRAREKDENGITMDHARVLRLSHPTGDGTGKTNGIQYAKGTPVGKGHTKTSKGAARKALTERDAIYRWVLGKDVAEYRLPALIRAHIKAMDRETNQPGLIKLITKYQLPWEAIPTSATTDPEVWRAMIPDMGLTALIRNLGGMTQYGALKPLEQEVQVVVDRLNDAGELRKARIHPFNILQALAVYRNGRSVRGSRSWAPIQPICDALDSAFYKAFHNVVPTGKRTLIALDVSGSMESPLNGSPLTVREGAAAMALVTMATEPMTHVIGFTSGRRAGGGWGYTSYTGVSPLDISAKMRLDNVVSYMGGLAFGGTDCALPMLYARKNDLKVDAIIIYTDNETYAGDVHPHQALKDYRKHSGLDTKFVAVGMTATEYSIGDPNDAGSLNVVGFDSAAPAVISDFIRGATPKSE